MDCLKEQQTNSVRWQENLKVNLLIRVKFPALIVIKPFVINNTPRRGKMESKLQVQVQIGDTRRVFLINPPRIYNDLRTAVYCVKFQRQNIWNSDCNMKTTKANTLC